MCKKKRLPCAEGTWFGVPLRTGGFAVGVLARVAGDGPAFGYFFGPRREKIPNTLELDSFGPPDAVLVAKFGDLGLLNGEWPVIGRHQGWNRNEWPLPPLVRVDKTENRAWMATYSDQLELVSDRPCDPRLANQFPEDSLWGYGAIEEWLTKRLDG